MWAKGHANFADSTALGNRSTRPGQDSWLGPPPRSTLVNLRTGDTDTAIQQADPEPTDKMRRVVPRLATQVVP